MLEDRACRVRPRHVGLGKVSAYTGRSEGTMTRSVATGGDLRSLSEESFFHGPFYRYALYDVLVRVSKPAASVTTVITAWFFNVCLIL